MDHEIDIFNSNPNHPRRLKGDGYDYVQNENGNWHNAVNGGMVSDYELRVAIVADNHKYDYVELEAIMARSEAYKEIHGHYPPDHDKKISEAHKKIAASYGDTGPGCTEYILVGGAAGLAIGTVVKYWDNITSAILNTGIVAAGAAATAVITVGAYKVSNFVWEKATGHSSPLKSALTTAALFATAAGGVYISNRPAETAPARPEAASPLQADFQKTLSLTIGQSYLIKDRATLHVKPSGIISENLKPGTCVEIKEVRPNENVARVYAGLPHTTMVGWVDAKAIDSNTKCTLRP